ncbi:hypothetical protein ASPZODRAFT_129088 [Penicilliopsis zonata CBS 506.65]|uniref:prephenate dehydratase n=1 Tax=Penicilliopsis zonata CBS 506.65 TaxID=1073090 RepID=A0A1L9SNG0_9EURO|nr:hypothetical protein ASPZODRAFT_129088 [Penicilliopsis zonata CBS 506.65]OJJ48782.1 hypothetical protein ASPZODRAFT_129088 [Penicilliopsis zonata CBS 506.65]
MEQLQVAFLGPPASFSHQAALEVFGSSVNLIPQTSFADAFAAVQQQQVDYAIIPVENSTNGVVVQTFDLFADRQGLYKDVKVCGEHYLAVHHCLLIRKDISPLARPDYGSIKKLYTHPQAWGQCDKFLSLYFKGVERQDTSSTSKGAEIVAKKQDEHGAAIASRFAAEYHGVEVAEANIEDDHGNKTRFLIIENTQSDHTNRIASFEEVRSGGTAQAPTLKPARKSLFSFTINQDLPGALADALLVFKAEGFNLTSINSRPSQRGPGQYIFFVECQLDQSIQCDDVVSRVLQSLRAFTVTCRELGTWKDTLQLSG